MFDGQPRVRLRRDLLADGHTDDELRQRRRAGELVVLRPGAYLPGTEAGMSATERHSLLVSAEIPRLASAVVVSHASAAVLHGLPVPPEFLRRVHVTRSRRNGARRGSAVHLHAAPLDRAEVCQVDGVAVTSVARTVVDLARTANFETAVVVADAALRSGVVDEPTLIAAVQRCTGWPGAPSARRVVTFADGRSESVGESRSRVVIKAAGLPPPTLQWKVWERGRMLARCDFAWPERKVVGEFDGRVKYGRLLLPGQDPGEVVFQEKVREDDLRALGLTVVRWIWRDLDAFGRKAGDLRAALALGR